MNKRIFTYKLPSGFSFHDFLNQLGESFSIRLIPEQDASLTFYDTFDWRLFSSSFVLFSIKNKLFLRKLYTNIPIEYIVVRKRIWNIHDFPKSKIKSSLTKIVGVRKLLPVAQTQEKKVNIILLNNENRQSAVLRYAMYKKDSEFAHHISYLQLEPVNENLSTFFETDFWLDSLGYVKSKRTDIFSDLFCKSDRNPGDYSSKLNIKLSSVMTASKAIIITLHYLLNIIKTNKKYILQDIDPEFLHDFRVACRRIKSILSCQKILIPEISSELKKECTVFLKSTNELRDLNVYLLNTEFYKSILPKDFRLKINFLFAYLKRRKKIILRALEKNSFEERIDVFLSKWETILKQNQEKLFNPSVTDSDIKTLAKSEINTCYKQIIKTGKLILKIKDPHKLHSLRIQVKKLRYLVDTYKSLFPATKIETLIKQLKNLQNNLGDFNDLFVQIKYLAALSTKISMKGKNAHDMLMAFGSLIGLLHQEKCKTENDFYSVFKDFLKPSNKTLFNELFSD